MEEEDNYLHTGEEWGEPWNNMCQAVDNKIRLYLSYHKWDMQMSYDVPACSVYHDTVDHFIRGQISRIHRRKMDFMAPHREPLSHLMDCALGTARKGMPDVPVVEPEDAHACAMAQ